MRTNVKIVVYVGLTAAGLLFALCFRQAYLLRAQGGSQAHALGMMGYGAATLGCLVLVGIMLARDFSIFFADKSYNFIFDDEGEGFKSPEYEHAEEVWKSGDPLEAVRLMRDYFERHPRELYVAIRMAEIYEKDLHNPLAAALEYEQILKNKLPPERWGWAAIHLVNLYGKLNLTDKGTALLQRINDEYGKTAAAKKARERLSIPEPEPEPQPEPPPPPPPPPAPEPVDVAQLAEELFAEEPLTEPPPPPPPPEPKLPPGFRPKKL